MLTVVDAGVEAQFIDRVGALLRPAGNADYAAAARSVQQDMGIVTIEMKTSFMRPAPATPGVPLIGLGKLLHRTRSMAFVEARIIDAEGELCAQSTGTFKYVPAVERPDHTRGPLPTD
jgi:uncharacterized protein (TIGR00369 family)